MLTHQAKGLGLVLVPLCLAFIASEVRAGAPITAGQVQQTLPQQSRAPRVNELPALEGAVPREGDIPAGGTPIPVQRFTFTGNTRVTTSDLDARVAGKTGQLTLAQIYAIARDLTRYYQSRGYPLSSVNVPAQKVEDGTVRFEVIEGRLGAVRVEGNKYYSDDTLMRHLDTLVPGQVLTSAVLERELLLLNDLPGVEARAVVVPGQQHGTSDLIVKVTEDGVSSSASLDNHGRDTIGKERLGLNLALNGMGRGDALNLGFTTSTHNLLTYYRVGYSMPLGYDGTRMELSTNRSTYEVDDPVFTLLDLEGEVNNLRLEFTRPTLRTRSRNSVIGFAVQRTDTENKSLGVVTSSQDATLFEIFYATSGTMGSSSVSSTFAYSGNLNRNGGTSNEDQLGKLTYEASFANAMSQDWSVLGRVRLAWSPDVLLDTEKFSIGGPYSLRGFDNSELRGDGGMDGSFELRRNLGPTSNLGVFADFGRVTQDRDSGVTPRSSETLASMGLNFGMRYGAFDFQLVWATPVSGDPADGEDSRTWAVISARF